MWKLLRAVGWRVWIYVLRRAYVQEERRIARHMITDPNVPPEQKEAAQEMLRMMEDA